MSKRMNRHEDPNFRKYVPFIDSDYNLFMLIHLTQTAMFRARHYEVKRVGLTHTEFQLLCVVEGLGEAAIPAEISRWMMRKPSTTSLLLHRMERNGLVKRIADTKNRKLKKVVMTKKGQQAIRRAQKQDVMNTIVGALQEATHRGSEGITISRPVATDGKLDR